MSWTDVLKWGNWYEEGARKLREIGPVEVNKHKISITFSCAGIQET